MVPLLQFSTRTFSYRVIMWRVSRDAFRMALIDGSPSGVLRILRYMSAEQDIQTGLDRIWSSDFVQQNPKKSYQAYHPDEYNRVKAYVEGGAEPNPFPTTLLGSGLALVERGRRQLTPPNPTPTQKPGIPTGLAAAVVNTNQVKLTWDANPASDQVDVYQAYMDDSVNLDLGIHGLEFTTPALSGTHTFRVSAHNVIGYGDWSASISATIIPPAPLPSEFKNELMLVRQSDHNDLNQLGHFGVVQLSSYRYGDVGAIKAQFPDCKVIAYKAASDCFDEGVGAVVPSQSIRMQSRSGVTYNEIRAHDQSNPGDKWVMTSNGSTPITPWYGYANVYGGNIGKASFRQQWVARLVEKMTAEPGWDGVFIDNVSVMAPGGWPAELPNVTVWRAAMKALIKLLSESLRPMGKLVCTNAVYYIGGDPGSDDGTGTIGWWQELAPYVDILFNEYPLQDPNNTAVVKLQGGGFPYSWDNWQSLVKVAQDAGTMGVLNVNMTGTQGGQLNTKQVRYGRASAMLDWDGSGITFAIDCYVMPWGSPVSFFLGAPAGSRAVTNGLHWRKFQFGYAIANPTSTSRTATIGNQSRTVPSGDGYIGA